MTTTRKRLWWRVASVALGLLVIVAAVFLHQARRRIPPGLINDVRAGLAAMNVRDPDERLAKYLELRYGAMPSPSTAPTANS
jgi:predicted kinase